MFIMKNRINANPCFKIFSDQKEFDKHVKAVHNISSPSLSANFESESNAVDRKNENHNALEELESSLLCHEREEEKAQ